MKISIKKRLSAVFTALLMTITAFGTIIAEAANLVCYEDLGYISSSAGLGGEQTLLSLDIGQEYYGICVHPNTSAHTSDNYVQSDADNWWNNTVTDSQKEAIGLICHYGYPNVDSKVYRAATQLLVWEIIGGKNTGPLRHYEEGDYASITDCSRSLLSFYSGTGDVTKAAVTKAYNEIVDKIASHEAVIDVAKDTKSEALGKPIVLTSGGGSVYTTTLYKQDKALWNDFGWTEALEAINGVTVEEWGYNSKTGLANYTIKSTVVYEDPIATAKRTKKSTVQNKKFNGLTLFINADEEDGQQICYGSDSPTVSAYLAIQTRNDGAEFSFEKVDSKTGKLIGSSSIPALFTIHKDAACATPPISSFNIGVSGTATIVLNTGVMEGDCFYVKEQVAVNGYKLSTKIYEAKPREVTTIPNERITGSIVINKSSEDDIIAGWNFEISYTDEEGLKTVEAVTDANGKATITDLPVYRTTDGSAIEYTVHEALTEEQLKNYKQLDIQTCKLTEGTAQFQVEMKFANERARGDIKVIKIAEDGKTTAIQGIDFFAVDENGYEFKETTDTAGIAVFEDLLTGTYTVYEDGNTVPVGYITAGSQTIVVVKDTVIDTEFLNKTTKVKITKYDVTAGEELAGATLRISEKDTGATVTEWVSTTEPHYIEGLLKAGKTYILTEVIAPEGYLLANDIEFTVSIDGSVDTVDMYDELIKGNIEVLKVDADYPDNKLTGAEFTVYNDVDADGVYNADIDTEYGKLIEADGTYSLTEIPYGHYLVKESKSPADFIADETYYPVFIQENSKTYTVANSSFGFANTEAKGTIEVHKTTEGMLNLEGIKLILEGTSAYGNPVHIEATTDASGIAVFENVPIGVYTITEDGSTVPYGYLTAEPTSVTVEYAEVTEVVIFNTELSGTIEVQKTTEGMVNLEGIKLILEGTSDTGRAIRIESTTDANGLATFEHVPVGTYTITEDGTTVPMGYLTAESTSVTVEYAEMTEVVIYNAEQSGSIVINKSTVDNNDEAIDDITFILEGTSDTGRFIRREAITDDNGVATFEHVPVGTYTITEDGTTVPMGYLTAEPTSVTVEYAKASNISVVNELMDLGDDRPNDTPQTGDKQVNPIVAVSFAGLLCAAALIRRKSERE